MQNSIDTFKELIIMFPKNKKLIQKHIDLLEELQNSQNNLFEVYVKSIRKKFDLILLGFEIAFQSTINQIELLNIELIDIESLLTKGIIRNEIALLNFSSTLIIRPKEITELYHKLIKGIEIDILEKAADNKDAELIDNLSTVRALIFYKDIIAKELFQIEQNNNKIAKPLPPQQTKTGTEQETPTFTNNFDNIKPTEIYKHFKAGLVEKGYLTEQELNEYLKAAFELKTKPEMLFKLKHTPTKQKIYTVFYVYYKDISQKKHERQKEYAALLGDFFEGYKTETIQTNWARDYKTKR